MEKALTLAQIGLYNPQRLSDEVVESAFVARQKIFQQLLNKVISELPQSIPQHYLIIATRGMGKTTLLKRIEVALRKAPYNASFVPLLFPEEQYNLKNIGEFWLNALDALADTLEVENQEVIVKKIDDKVGELDKKNPQVAKAALNFLKAIAKEIGRRPVLLVDNMNLLFDRFEKQEQHQLRAWLMENEAPIIIGASAINIEATHDYGAPFYDAFQMYYLQKLSYNELIEILENLAQLTQNDTVMSSVHQHSARLKTIHQLTGGNPRTTVMLFRLIVKGFAENINDDLDALLDEVTPLYKARFEEMPVQMQVIVDAIALHWDPITLEALREATGLENNQLSPQLKRLAEAGWIDKVDAYQAKGSAYQITERFFNIWFLMRRSSRRQKKELDCLTRFFEVFYGEDVDKIARQRLDSQCSSSNHVLIDLAFSQAVKDPSLRKELQQRGYAAYLELAKNNPNILKEFYIPQEIIKEYQHEEQGKTHTEAIEQKLLRKVEENPTVDNFLALGNYYYLSNKPEASEKAYLKAIELDSKWAYPWNGLGNLYQYHLSRYEASEKAYLRAIELDSKWAYPWYGLGNLYQYHLSLYEASEKAYLKAIELDSKWEYPWNNLGNLYQNLERYEASEKAYLKAIELDSKDAYPWNNLGNLYQNLERYEASEKAFLKAIELDTKYATPWNNLGNLYKNLSRYEASEKAFLKAIELDSKYVYTWNGLGNLYQDLKRYEASEKAYLKAIELDSNFEYPKYNLVFLYRDKLQRLVDARKLFDKIPLKTELEDSHYLNQALFELYSKNDGNAKTFFERALHLVEKGFKIETQDDWWRFAAVALKLGYGKWVVEVFESTKMDKVLAPYYAAVKSQTEADAKGYLHSVAVEVRMAAELVLEKINAYRK